MTQDACPQRDDPEVRHPIGLWGFHAIVEEPLISTDGAAPVPPTGVRGDLGVSYLAADLSDGPRLADLLAQVVISQVETVEHNNPVGSAYGLPALSDTKVTLSGVVAAIDAEVKS